MSAFAPVETLHRLVKQAMDSGAVASLVEAENLAAAKKGYEEAMIPRPG